MGDGNSMLARGLAHLAGFLYRHADRVVVVTPAFEDYLVEHWHVPQGKDCSSRERSGDQPLRSRSRNRCAR